MKSSNYSFIGVGSPIVDTLIEVDDSFISQIDGDKGGMVLVSGDEMQSLLERVPTQGISACGGSAGNTAFALARLGASCTFLGKVGNDEAGLYYMNTFGDLGGDTSRFKVGHVPNARCLSLITPDSQRTLRTDLGAAATLDPKEISASDFLNCKHAHVEGYLLFNRDLIVQVLKSAKAAGTTVSLDLASFEVVNACKDVLPDLIRDYVDIVFANEDEAKAFLGDKPYDKLAEELQKLASIAVVKMGANGSYIASNQGVEFSPAQKGIQAVDTTGAGDFYAAGFLYGWLNQKPLLESGKLGALLGAEIVQVIGATLSNDRWDEIKKTL